MNAAKTNRRSRSRRRTPRGKRRPFWVRAIRQMALVVAVAVAVPLLGTPLFHFGKPVSTLMLWERVAGGEVHRDWIPIEEVSPNLIRAVISSEDNFYCRHHGVDWGSVREVLVTGSDRGASTIAMQAARNLMLWQGRSYLRKALEVPIALYADIVLGKRRIMEIYLNVAEWGPGVFGIEAAARHHFGVSASDLTIRQATLLAVTLPNPHNRDPANPTASLSGLAETIGARVADGVDTSCLDL